MPKWLRIASFILLFDQDFIDPEFDPKGLRHGVDGLHLLLEFGLGPLLGVEGFQTDGGVSHRPVMIVIAHSFVGLFIMLVAVGFASFIFNTSKCSKRPSQPRGHPWLA